MVDSTNKAPRGGNPPPGKFFVALMSPRASYHDRAEQRLVEQWGPLDHRSQLYCFSQYSNYYDQEMGGAVWKYFVTLKDPFPLDTLLPLKQFTERLQLELGEVMSQPARRQINLDPGYVTGWNLVLATVKNHAHRIYLGHGIFCEVTLIFRNREFQPLPWTYADYACPQMIEFFTRVRRDLLLQLR